MNELDQATVFAIIAALSLVLPLNTWVALAGQRTAAVRLWCLGGVLNGVSLLLIIAGPVLPYLLVHNGGRNLLIGSFLLQIFALGLELGKRWPARWLWAVFAADIILFAVLDAWVSSQTVTLYTRGMQIVMVGVIVGLAWQLARRERSAHARALGLVYALLLLILINRWVQTLTGLLPGIHVPLGAHGSVLALAVVGVGTVIIGQFSFMGLIVQKALREQARATLERERLDERLQIYEKLARLERQQSLGVISTSLGQALQQPLASILTHNRTALRHLRAGQSDPAVLTVALGQIIELTRGAARLIERIRTFMRPASARRETVDLRQLLLDVWEMLRHEARDCGIRVDWQGTPTRLPVAGHAVQLTQALFNLMHNAIDAMAPAHEGVLTIAWQVVDDHVCLTLRDTGPGFPPAVLNRPDTPFMAVADGELSMGLLIARDVLTRYDGRLELSNGPRGGAVVEVCLPVLPAGTDSAAAIP